MNQLYALLCVVLLVGFSSLASVEARFGLPKEFGGRHERDSKIKNICGRERNVRKDQVLGEGSYGKAYLVPIDENSPDSGSAVLKVPRPYKGSYLVDEIRNLLRAGEHPNIAKVIGVCPDEEAPLLMLEYLDGGSLQSWLKSNFPQGNAPPVQTQYKILSQVVDALYWIERRKLVHSDLGTRNIVVQGDVVKLIDFGISEQRDNPKTLSDMLEDDVLAFCKLSWTLAQGSAQFESGYQDLEEVQRLEREVYKAEKGGSGPSNPKWIPKLLRMCIKANKLSKKTWNRENSLRRISKFLGGLVPRPTKS